MTCTFLKPFRYNSNDFFWVGSVSWSVCPAMTSASGENASMSEPERTFKP